MKMDGSGDGPARNGGSSLKVDPSSTSSPLQIFVQAKKSINDIFIEIEDYINETCTFVLGNLPADSVLSYPVRVTLELFNLFV